MSAPEPDVTPASPWDDAIQAAALFAVDPAALGGVAVRALPGPVRTHWLESLRDLLPPDAAYRRVPLQVSDSRLLGGLDLAATLRAGRPVAERGVLAEADGGVIELAMAERVAVNTAARLTSVLDAGEVVLERDGIAARNPARFGVVALDEGVGEDEGMAPALLDRLAFHLDLRPLGVRDLGAGPDLGREDVAAARARLGAVRIPDEVSEALCAVALALGVGSLRGSLFAIAAARANAALAGREAVADEDLALAARLVLAPRATRFPAQEPAPDEEPPPPEPPEPDDESGQDDEEQREPDGPLEERVLDAARAAIPADLLERLRLGTLRRARNNAAGKAGALQHASLRGRPIGTRRGDPGPGVRLDLIETLRAAAPWQRIRRREAGPGRKSRIEVRRDDFRITRFKLRAETTTIFVVDASGSSALHRLAEAKGAIELLLASCYVRRDRVALVAFRGQGAELLLPPTRSLVRAKRELASLPGGGGTPLASGIDMAMVLADAVRRRGGTATVVLLTDGRANVSRDGRGGRARAGEEALASARLARAEEIRALLVDTSPRPQARAKELAEAMGALYLPLPYADASMLTGAVQAAAG